MKYSGFSEVANKKRRRGFIPPPLNESDYKRKRINIRRQRRRYVRAAGVIRD